MTKNEELLLKADSNAPNLLENCEGRKPPNLLPKRTEPIPFINNNFLFCVKHTKSPLATNFLTQEFLMGSNSNNNNSNNNDNNDNSNSQLNDLSVESTSVPKQTLSNLNIS